MQEDIGLFDAAVFNISADVASVSQCFAANLGAESDKSQAMDPQLRLLMESVYKAIESGELKDPRRVESSLKLTLSAGIPAEKMSGSNTSVFSRIFARDYFDTSLTDAEVLPASFMIGNGVATFSNRISHFFDLQGASMTIDTGCSTSTAALHQAVRTIQLGESDISIVGSACALLNPGMFIAMSSMKYVVCFLAISKKGYS